jgi:hypothetical protein
MCGVEHQKFGLGSDEHNNWLRNRGLFVLGVSLNAGGEPNIVGGGAFLFLVMKEAEASFVLPLRTALAHVAC